MDCSALFFKVGRHASIFFPKKNASTFFFDLEGFISVGGRWIVLLASSLTWLPHFASAWPP